jgi:bacterioferritin-associated ferredoxin
VPQLDLAITLGALLEDSDDGNQVVAVDAGQRTSVPALLVAGELSGIGGAALAVREGQLAGESALTAAGRAAATSPARLAQVRRDVARGRAFARAMRLAHPVPPAWTEWLTDDTLACRCEEVPVSRVRAAVASGASDARQVKQLTRTGMGWCQGRMCGYAAACLAGEVAPSDGRASRGSLPAAYPVVAATERLVATPVPLGSLAREV